MPLNTLLDQGVTVLTASRRLAHAVRLQFAQHARQQGLSVWRTPQVLPWSAWLRQQWLEDRAAAEAFAQEPGPARLLTSAQARVLWDEIVAASPLAADLLNRSNAARLAARSWQRMHEYLIPVDSLAGTDSAEGRALHAWCREFIRRCDSLQAMDEARLTRWAFERRFVPPERIALAGFDVVPPAMQALIERWREYGRIADVPAVVSATVDVVVASASDASMEIELAARWARAQIEDRREDQLPSIGVIVGELQSRQSEVRRAFEDVFAPGMRSTQAPASSMPVVIAAPQSLSAYPVVDAALLALRFTLGERSSTHAGQILRSAFFAGGDSERDRRALADLRLREEQRDRWSWYELERWAGVTGCEQMQLAARELNDFVRQNSSQASPSRWAERFHAMLRSVGWPGERMLSSIEHQTVQKFQAALAELGTLDAVLHDLTLQQALARLEDLTRDTPFEPETEAAAVTVIDATTVAGMQFDALWITGLDATRMPHSPNPDPLLPLDLQRAAGIPEASAATVLSQSKIELGRLMASAPAVVCSWAEREGDAELRASPLLAPWIDRPAAPIARAPVRTLRRTLFDERPRLTEVIDDRAPALEPGSVRGGTMILELQSRCPFRAQAELRLRAQQLPRVSIGIEPLDRGIILHRVLAELWSTLRTQQMLLATDEAALERQVREIAERQAARTLQPGVRYRARLTTLEIESAVRQVMRLLASEKQRQSFAVRFAEAAATWPIGGLVITLQPDRIDELGGGGHLLIDYKLGDSHQPRQWLDVWPGRPRRPQLPLYGLANAQDLRALAFAVLAPGAVEYRGWSDGAPIGPGVLPYPAGIRLRPGDPLDWNELLRHWQITLTRLAQRFVAGEARADPLPQECDTCHLSTLCRIHERAIGTADAEAVDD